MRNSDKMAYFEDTGLDPDTVNSPCSFGSNVNSPDGGNAFFIYLCYGFNDRMTQIASEYDDNGNRVFIRNRINGKWRSWIQLH